jgi:hypothetical protein
MALFLLNFSAGADTLLKTPSEAALRDAVAAGGRIQFQFNGQIEVNQLEVLKPTVLDATGYRVTLYGAQKRILHVSSTFFAATNITFQGGGDLGAGAHLNNNTLEGAVAGKGGAILSENSELSFENCQFLNNGAVGGDGTEFILGYPPGQQFAASGASGEGGALHLTGCTAVFQNCRFEGNGAQGGAGTTYLYTSGINPRWVPVSGGSGVGGAIFAKNSSIELHNNEFAQNNARAGRIIAEARGGAIFLNQNMFTATHCKFRENSAIGAPSYAGFGGYLSEGGAMEVQGTAEFSECVFVGNSVRNGEGSSGATYGGAAYCFGIVHMDRCQLLQNSAVGATGGIENALGGALFIGGEYGLTNCTISGNSVKGGFGAWGTTEGHGSIFIPGSALGGGVYCGPGGGLVQFCTFISNSSSIVGSFPTPLALAGGAGLAATYKRKCFDTRTDLVFKHLLQYERKYVWETHRSWRKCFLRQ